ncbi:MAG TPA: RQC domain-containing protein, partial [bacterium]|nr:RQC domain-containing protein [bacterium]
MGIDKPDVRLVVHYSFPKSLEGYYQEIGRAGRDGLASDCVMFYTYADAAKHRYFIRNTDDLALQAQAEQKLQEVIDFAGSKLCRRAHILKYFGENSSQLNCQSCDNCTIERTSFDGTIITQKILSTILRTGSRFGENHIIAILLGKKSDKIKTLAHDQLSVYGLGQDFTDSELKDFINQLLHSGLLKKSTDQYATLSLTTAGSNFLNTKATINLNKIARDEEENKRRKAGELDYDQGLFDKLRHLRKTLADQESVPPFVIFSDNSLQEMSYYLPTTRDSFSQISGVGTNKLDKYSSDFIQIISAHATANNLKSKAISNSKKTTAPKKIKALDRQAAAFILNLTNKKLSIAAMAKSRKLTPTTIFNHLERLIDSGAQLNIDYLKPKEPIWQAISKAVSKHGSSRLKPIFEELNGKVDYETIKTALLIIKTKK